MGTSYQELRKAEVVIHDSRKNLLYFSILYFLGGGRHTVLPREGAHSAAQRWDADVVDQISATPEALA